MFAKAFLLVFGLLALNWAIEARYLSELEHKHQELEDNLKTRFSGLKNYLRKRRSTEEAADSSEEAKSLIKFFLNLGWETDKLSLLSGFLEEIIDSDTNVTIVGWQRVAGEDGKLREVNLVQLVIPPKPQAEGEGEKNDTADSNEDLYAESVGRVVPTAQINELKEIFQPLAELGIPASVTYQEFTEDGDEIGRFYLDETDLEIHTSNFSIYNRTIEASPQEVEGFVKTLQGLQKPAVIKYDSAGKLLRDKSTVTPLILGNVVDHYEIPDDILLAAPKIISELYVEFPKEQIARELGVRFNEKWPEYRWRVLVDASDFYVTRDTSLTLSFDNVDLDINSDVSYFVWGVKKEIN